MRSIGGVRNFGGGGSIVGITLACLVGLSTTLAMNRNAAVDISGSKSGASIFESGFEGAAPLHCGGGGVAIDGDGDGLLDLRCIEHTGSPDPVSTASPLDPAVPADFAEAIDFLYDSPDPVQHGVLPDTFRDYRIAVLRGKVENEAGQPFEGVLVRALDHPEYGYTYTRADGMFDLVVNGGGEVVLDYHKEGFIRVQRRVQAPWRDWAWAEDAMLVPFDVTENLLTFVQGMPAQVARGSLVEDADGPRQATLLIPPATGAQLRMHDGTTMPMPALRVRATEYTVGDDGAKRMPAKLPATSAYTYGRSEQLPHIARH